MFLDNFNLLRISEIAVNFGAYPKVEIIRIVL